MRKGAASMTAEVAPPPQPAGAGVRNDPNRLLRHMSILVLDGDPAVQHFLAQTLRPLCLRIEAASNAAAASRCLDAQHYDLVIFENVMPGQSGLEWLTEQRAAGFAFDAVLMTAHADLDTAIYALQAGAADLVLKPFRTNQIVNAVRRCIAQRQLRRENFLRKHQLGAEGQAARGRLLGHSPQIEAVRDALERAARQPTLVLLTGESGTGKEIAARTLHAMSERADRPFVAINCAALSAGRGAAELFGEQEPGGKGRDGMLLRASGGTLFFDEIAGLPLPVQATLLRVLDDNRLWPVGADGDQPLNLRFVFATNADLERAVTQGQFRSDLYHRINVLRLHLPPLRERVGDIADLAKMFIARLSQELGVAPLHLSTAVALNLARHDWPGNVRELRNMIERSLILGAFPAEFAAASDPPEVEAVEALHVMERHHIQMVLEACGGNRAEAARRLGVSRKTIDRKCALWKR
ncbi:MAG: sigma-54 dependent transcriptional regulator [Pseudorhodobacter sp.]|nr:sigma-54 dependent transcriptional regulator [Pseudorhodobacter sp.]